jgi:hypothetical protein
MDDPLVPVDGVLCFPSIHLRWHSDGAGGAIELGADFCGACVRTLTDWRWSRKDDIRSQYSLFASKHSTLLGIYESLKF